MIHAFANGISVPVFGRRDASAGEIKQSIALLEKSGSIEYARSRAGEMVERGKNALEVLPDTRAKATLLKLADYMVKRSY
jgi:geranylgeranyl diphosphate synthase type I